MRDVQPVQILYGVEDLIEDASGCTLLEADLVGHHSEEFSLLGVLSDDVDVVGSLDNFVEVDDVGVPHLLHDLHLPLDADLVVLILDGLLVDDFDGHLFASGEVLGLLDFAEGALPQGAPQFVVADAVCGSRGVDLFVHVLHADLVCQRQLFHPQK